MGWIVEAGRLKIRGQGSVVRPQQSQEAQPIEGMCSIRLTVHNIDEFRRTFPSLIQRLDPDPWRLIFWGGSRWSSLNT